MLKTTLEEPEYSVFFQEIVIFIEISLDSDSYNFNCILSNLAYCEKLLTFASWFFTRPISCFQTFPEIRPQSFESRYAVILDCTIINGAICYDHMTVFYFFWFHTINSCKIFSINIFKWNKWMPVDYSKNFLFSWKN